MNKIFNKLYRLKSTNTREKEYRVRSGGAGYEKLKTQLAQHELTIACCYNKWYNIYDKNGNNVRVDVFDSLQDVRDWIKYDLSDYLASKQ